MRACIAYRQSSTLHKAVWFNESSTGLYLGYFGSRREHHHSFHRDGWRHLRTRESKDLLPRIADRPISAVKRYRHLLNAQLALTGGTTFSKPFVRTERADIVLMLDEAETGDYVYYLDYYLLNKTAEAEYLHQLDWWPKRLPPHRIILCTTIRLTHFPDHKVSLVVSSMALAGPLAVDTRPPTV